MIVIFGPGADAARHATTLLLDAGQDVLLVGRSREGLDPRAKFKLGGPDTSAIPQIDGATTVVSCAHPIFVPGLLTRLPESVKNVVLMGSMWRYSNVPGIGPDTARDAESAFLASPFAGTIAHCAMIYGGARDRNVRALFDFLKRWRVCPLPGGGRQMVQPVHFEDAGACLAALAIRSPTGKQIMHIAGERPMTWAEMAREVAAAAGVRFRGLPLPLTPAIALVRAGATLGLRAPVAELQRFRESTIVDTADMHALGVWPRPFREGLRAASYVRASARSHLSQDPALRTDL